MAKSIRLIRAEFNTAVKYETREGFVNDFPITFKYSKPEYLIVQVGFKVQDPKAYTVVHSEGMPVVRFPKDLVPGMYVTLRSRTDSEGIPHTYHYVGNSKGQSEFNQATIDENFQYLDRIVEEVNDTSELTQDSLGRLEDEFGEVSSGFDEVKQMAQEALATSEDALTKADTAVSTADNALDLAGTADTNASTALTTAKNALSAANRAEGTAGTALGNAAQALKESGKAVEDSSNALEAAKKAESTANTAKEVAEGIEAKADQAVETANEASGTATEAWETATGIAGVANDALETATNANEKAQEALDKATEGGITETELIEKSLGDGKWIRETKLKEEIDAIPKPDMSEYRKLDNNKFVGFMQVQAESDIGTGVFLVCPDGKVRGQMIYNNYGLQFAQVQEDSTYQTFTFPRYEEGGEIAMKSLVDSKWDIQDTLGTGSVVRESEVTKKADTSYVNTELGKKRDKSDNLFPSIYVQTDKGRTAYGLSAGGIPFISIKVGTGTEYYANFQNKTGTVALTSDIPSLSGYATQSWVNSKGYTTLGTANANSSKLGAEQNTSTYIDASSALRAVPSGCVITKLSGSGRDSHVAHYRPITRV